MKPEIEVINEPAYTGCNAPDFLFKKGTTPIAYAECKDVSESLDKHHKQAQRYVEAFGKILLTNYFEFEIIKEDADPVKIAIANKDGDSLRH